MGRRPTELSEDAKQIAASLIRLLETLRARKSGMTVAEALLLMQVAYEPYQGPGRYSELTGILRGHVSRTLLQLGPKDRVGNEGLRLVDSDVDERDYRLVHYYLTARGQALIDQIINTFRETCRQLAYRRA